MPFLSAMPSPSAGRAGGPSTITLIGVSKTYPPKRQALVDINAHIDKGEFVFLTGPSGAGKSTFLRLVYREELPTRGQLIVAGRDLTRLRPRHVPYLRRQIGVVFQDFRLLPDRTVWENVAFPLVVTEASGREIQRRVPLLLELVGLREHARARPHELSGGEQQRCALARAMALNPPILLADEPTGNLDPELARGITDLLEEINRMGTTVVMATHAEAIVNRMRRRVMHLHAGRLVRDEDPGRYRHEA